MVFKKRMYISLCVFMFSTSMLSADTWKMFFYMDSSADLSDMAFKNITDMMRGVPNDLVDIVIQLHAYGNVALRYNVINNGLMFLDEVALSGDAYQDFIDAANWAFADVTADHTMLIFSNHGWGALDPRLNPESGEWEAAELSLSNDSGVSCSVNITTESDDSFPELSKRSKKYRTTKGFMFNDQSKTYLANNDLFQGLSYVKNNLLNYNNIDIVAFDTCMGSMVEVAAGVAPYSNYLVGVQSCALKDGFDYQGFIRVLNQGLPPCETAQGFIDAFDTYYAQNDAQQIYTCAAVDMMGMAAVIGTLNDIVDYIVQRPELTLLLAQARDESPRFCLWPIYSDVVAFLKLVENNLEQSSLVEQTAELIPMLYSFYDAVSNAVIARCGGSTTAGNAYGMSIYLPSNIIDSSYRPSAFTYYSRWIELLNMICVEEE